MIIMKLNSRFWHTLSVLKDHHKRTKMHITFLQCYGIQVSMAICGGERRVGKGCLSRNTLSFRELNNLPNFTKHDYSKAGNQNACQF